MFGICSEMILGSNKGKSETIAFCLWSWLHEINTAHSVLVTLFEFGGSEVCVPCGKCAVVVNMHQIGFLLDFLKCSGAWIFI